MNKTSENGVATSEKRVALMSGIDVMTKTSQSPQLGAIQVIINDMCDEYGSKQVKMIWDLFKRYDKSDISYIDKGEDDGKAMVRNLIFCTFIQ